MGRIYKITNKVNNKVYIGQTIWTIEERWRDHVSFALGDRENNNAPLQRAIRKYGPENFKIELVEDFCSKENIDEREIYWIKYYNSFGSGYNATTGGTRGLKLDIDEDLMVKLYHETKSLRRVASHFGVDKDCISDRIKNLKIPIYTMGQQKNTVSIYRNESDELPIITLDNKTEAAKWFIENKIPKSNKVHSVRRGIVNNTPYYGYYIKINDKI